MREPGASVFRELTLKMMIADPFETLVLVPIYRITWCHVPEVRELELDTHRHKSFKFHTRHKSIPSSDFTTQCMQIILMFSSLNHKTSVVMLQNNYVNLPMQIWQRTLTEKLTVGQMIEKFFALYI
jgi:hypothetical protein